MKRAAILAALVFALVIPRWVAAQETQHAEVGVFADYFRLHHDTFNKDFLGVGGRLGFNVHPNVQLEAEMAYDFSRAFENDFNNGGGVNVVRTNTRIIHGLFGPKFQTSAGSFKVFATGKVGLISFTSTNQGVQQGFVGGLGAIDNGNMKFAVYPGAGIEGFVGPVGVRLEVGDDIYFDNGARNNLRVTLGPTFRF